jgi:enediyne biosynthesis protein E4
MFASAGEARFEALRYPIGPTHQLSFNSGCRTLGLLVVAFTIQSGSPIFAIAQNEGIKSKDDAATGISFRKIGTDAGIAFRFDTGSRGQHDLPEIMGGGVALFDVDGDGRLDIYLCNGGPIEPTAGKRSLRCRLYHNEGGWRFKDISDRAAAPGASYSMGAAVGDYDGDGRLDLFVTGWRDQRLYQNLGDGRFQDVTNRAGVGSDLWSTSAAFADLDGDGDLDLYVANYLDFDVKSPPYCAAPDGRRDYCGPEDFPAQADRLYRNNGDSTFTDIARLAGIDQPEGRGLGVLIAELTGDNLPDIFVANDGTACWLFANRGNLRFEEIGAAAGVARDGHGQPLAGMGVAAGDLNGDGVADVVVTNFFGRSTIAFEAQTRREAAFADTSARLELARCTRSVLGFGIALADFDADGHLDLIQANGHVLDRARLGTPFAMRPVLLRNRGDRFEDIAALAGDWFHHPILGRGLAVGDLDDDGRVDVVVNALDAPAAVLHNTSHAGHILAVDVVDRLGRPAVGARVRITAGKRDQVALVVAGGSYLSSSPGRLHFGLGSVQVADRIEVEWPWGGKEVWTTFAGAAGPSLIIKQGTGKPLP